MQAYSREELEEAGLLDFRVFLIEVWAYLGLPRPTPVQLDIAYQLQHGPKRGIIQAFRGVGKSWITVAFVLWTLLLDPQKKIMVVSANESLAADFVRFSFQLIEGMPILQHLAPRPEQRRSSEKFDVGPAAPSKDPSVKSVGITGQLTGSRADLIVGDDVEVPKNSYTAMLRKKLADSVKEFDAVLKPGDESRIIYLGTPQVEATLYGDTTEDQLGQRGYVTMIWPIEIPKKLDSYKGNLGPYVKQLLANGAQPGDPVDPKRFDRADIAERKASYGLTAFALQFMLDTSPDLALRHPLKLRDLIVMDLDRDMAPVKLVWGTDRHHVLNDLPAAGINNDNVFYGPNFRSPEMASYGGTVAYVDPSGRGKDETALAIVKVLHSQLFLVCVAGYRDGYSEDTLKSIAAKCLRYGVRDVVVEENFGGGMFSALLKPWLVKLGAGRLDEEYKAWSVGAKEERYLSVLEPIVQSHRLIVSREVIEEDRTVAEQKLSYSFIHQFTRAQRVKGALAHDDRVEAVAGACAYYTSKMSQDQDRALEANREEALRNEYDRFMAHAVGVEMNSDPIWN